MVDPDTVTLRHLRDIRSELSDIRGKVRDIALEWAKLKLGNLPRQARVNGKSRDLPNWMQRWSA